MLFCPECGNKLKGTEVFCNECGTRVKPAEAPVMEAPVVPVIPAEEAVIVPEEAPVVAEEIPADIDIPVDDPMIDEEPEVAEEAEPVKPNFDSYSTPVAPVEKPKKKKSGKALWIILPIVVLLLAGLVLGGLYLVNTAYEEAFACLDAKDYEGALEQFGKFSFYKDSQDMIDKLESLQADYDDAKELLEKNQYIEAKEAFAALGDYRDSQALVATQIPYSHAVYLMESAADNDSDALSQHPDYDDSAAYDRSGQVLLYEGAADLFAELDDYEDSADRYSECYLQIASLFMNESRFEEALEYETFLNQADAAALQDEYRSYCFDDTILAVLEESVVTRMDMEDIYYDDPYMTEEDLVNAEFDILSAYYEEDLMFYDAELEELFTAYVGGLVIESSVIQDNGFYSGMDAPTWYTGRAARCAVVERLIEKYDFLSAYPELQETFAGSAEYYVAASALEQALLDQLIGMTEEYSDELGYYMVFENTTSYEISLLVYNEYCDYNYDTIFYCETDWMSVMPGETVNLPFQFPETDDWEHWYTGWEYDIIIP